MPVAKKEAAHDCKKDCELLHKEIAALKKEIAALKSELKKAPKGGGGADARVDLLVEWIQVAQLPAKLGGAEKREKILKSLGVSK